ncbi:glucuronate isomerase [Flexilinea flocculi]|uniref:Uronate isomerase n=1 Tax=Flexilinea flocculi TaxID=1678840 RepID=A0A0S7BUK2_9CHLR|nr:glucuronate isomerase [Flexilinea flocculi]GAP41233.1 glucuronate isomerase [Flexilinea flocculi]
MSRKWILPEDRFFDPDDSQKKIALEIYHSVKDLPIVSPHGHVDPKLFSKDSEGFGTPADLLIIPDHYVFRLFYSQGLRLEDFGIPRRDGSKEEIEQDHRKIWQRFADNFHMLRTTASYSWLAYEFKFILGIDEIPDSDNAQEIYDDIYEKLKSPEFQPRNLFDRFQIEVLSTTDGAADSLSIHQEIKESGWKGNIIPAFRPDSVMNITSPNFKQEIDKLSNAAGIDIIDFKTYIRALESRRQFFKSMGAVSTDHAVVCPMTSELPEPELNRIFTNALKGESTEAEQAAFSGHMLNEMARMSCEDGMVMQLHPGVLRNHNHMIYDRFGADKGCDIPVTTEFTRNLQPLLSKFGNNPRFTLCLFTVDEYTYSRELAPLAGHYPAIRLGPPWWFNDSWNGMTRFFDSVTETAGLYNLSGFIDDTRAFPSIPARHDVWRRVVSNWLAKMVSRSFIDTQDALDLANMLVYRQPKSVYKLG